MKNKESEIAKAEKLYIHLNYTFKDIASELKRQEKTIGKWAKDGKWKEKKAAEESGPERLCHMLLMENLAIAEEAKEGNRRITSAEADKIYKNTCTINNYKKDGNLIAATTVFKRYNNWLVERNSDLAKANTEYQRQFLNSIAGE